ncbi:MAG: hypothetical protein II111_03895 [Oscillospiraceae bacterium]|jgi:V/A-type H+-transporting ATPase subunit G/H|nr:hypothetical protein [Oscillospiraceae bacterium]
MSADVMERILALEAEQRALYEQAAAENKQKLVVARHTLERRDEDRRRISESEGRGMLEAAEKEAAQETQGILKRAEEDCTALKTDARERLDAVADWIVERVVSD